MSYIFCIEIVTKKRQHVRLILLLFGCGKMCPVMSRHDKTYQGWTWLVWKRYGHKNNSEWKINWISRNNFFLSCITLMFNQAAGFLDHQYLLKEAIFVLDFFNQDLYQRKIVLKSNTSGWVWSGVTNHIETFLSLLCGTWLVWRL